MGRLSTDDSTVWDRVRLYRRVFRNSSSLLAGALLGRFPRQGVFRNGRVVQFLDSLQLFYAALYEDFGWKYTAETDTVLIPRSGGAHGLVFEGSGHDGDLAGVFGAEVYAWLDVKGRDVLDVGSNIGDSTVYFATRGARRVIGLEPFEIPFEYARRNVAHNQLIDTIELLRAGCGAADGEISLPRGIVTTLGCAATHGAGSLRAPVFSLRSLVDRYGLSHAVLKVDCEGCEYAVLTSGSTSALQAFDEVQVEYHYGLGAIPQALAESGFKVEWSDPVRRKYRDQIRPMDKGWIRARRLADHAPP